MSELAITQLPTINLTPTSKFLSSMIAFLILDIALQRKRKEKALFIRLPFDLIRFLWHWRDAVALETLTDIYFIS